MTSRSSRKLLDQVVERLADERSAYVARERSQPARDYSDRQEKLLGSIREVGKTGDITLILEAERRFLRNEMRFYSNSAGQRGSLKSALQELDQAEKMLPLVKDSALYIAVDASHGNAKSRISGLPRDAARHFFASHNARLLNADKSRLTETEKKIVDARRHNIRVAALAYTALQEKSIAIDQVKAPDQSLSM